MLVLVSAIAISGASGEDIYDDRMAATVPMLWDMQHQCCVGHCVKG